VSSRRERKEALRREREERERAAHDAERRRRLVGYGAGGALVAAAAVVVVVLLLAGGGGGGGGGDKASASVLPDGGSVPTQKITDLQKAADAGNCELKSFKATSREHTTDINERVRYKTNPPTAGKHYQVPADDGAYGQAPPDTAVVHASEHGRIIIWFKPSLPREQRADLKALFDDDPYQMLLVPRAAMPYAVAATAWSRDPEPNGTGRVLGCPSVSASLFDALRAFRDDYRGDGPEAIP
jgi:Protein of unknown function (DUF3105)